MPASLGPGLRTVSGAKRRRDETTTVRPAMPCGESSTRCPKTWLAIAIAQGREKPFFVPFVHVYLLDFQFAITRFLTWLSGIGTPSNSAK
jgi:hypothetical protein